MGVNTLCLSLFFFVILYGFVWWNEKLVLYLYSETNKKKNNMNAEVKKENVNGTIVFNYKGIEIDKTTWESAPIPICCKNIDDDAMCCIVRTLYDIIVQEYGQDYMDKYIKRNEEFYDNLEWDNVDDFRWTEEEKLFIEWGGVYYEDLN